MNQRVDFSANAGVYDRRHGAVVPDDAVQLVWSAARLQSGARVLDVGAGTGRVAIPLARLGCLVTAIEPSRAMLEQLKAKAGRERVGTAVAEGAHLPFPAERFDAVVIARLLYLTADWRAILHNAHRTLAAGGCLLHEWGNGEDGEEWVRIRDEARRLFEHAGLPSAFHPGVRSEAEVDEALVHLGMTREADVDIGAGPELTLREFLRRLVDGELSYIWSVPEDVRTRCLPQLTRWAQETFELDRSIAMPRRLRWTVYRKVQ